MHASPKGTRCRRNSRQSHRQGDFDLCMLIITTFQTALQCLLNELKNKVFKVVQMEVMQKLSQMSGLALRLMRPVTTVTEYPVCQGLRRKLGPRPAPFLTISQSHGDKWTQFFVRDNEFLYLIKGSNLSTVEWTLWVQILLPSTINSVSGINLGLPAIGSIVSVIGTIDQGTDLPCYK